MVDTRAYCYLKVDKLLCKRAHLIVEAKSIFPCLACCENEIALSFFLAIQDHFLIWANYFVINVE